MSIIQWIPKSDAPLHLPKPILSIYACAHPATAITASGTAGTRKTNHWVLHCAISATESIRIDPSPSGPNMSIIPIFTFQNSLFSYDAVKTVQLVTTDLTIQGLTDLIEARRYDRYRFSGSGQGCRFWVYSVVKLLEEMGYVVQETAVTAVTDVFGRVWNQNATVAPAVEQSPITKGEFYE